MISGRAARVSSPHLHLLRVCTELAAPGSSLNHPNASTRATMTLHALARRAASGTIPANRSNNVAFIGLGRMGYEMATNLWRKKFAQNNSGELIVCDARQEVAMRFVEETSGKGASFVKTPREYVRQRYICRLTCLIRLPRCYRAVLSAGTIITMLPSSPHVLSVYEGFSEGIIPTLKELPTEEARKTLCIDSTTCHISTSQDLAQILGQAEVNIVDAPVSGGGYLDPLIIFVDLLLNQNRCGRR